MQAATTRCARPDAPAAVPTWGRRQRRQHQQLQRRLCARAAGAPPDIDARVYTDASAQPAHFVGTVQPALIPGKGRGLLAARALVPGQLLLVAPPLALVEGGLGEIPEHDELQEVIAASGALFSPWQAAWLKALATTTGSSSDGAAARGAAAGGAHAGALKQLPSLLPPAGEGAWCGQSSPDHHQQQQQQAAGPQAPRVPFQALGMDEERLWAAIGARACGMEGRQACACCTHRAVRVHAARAATTCAHVDACPSAQLLWRGVSGPAGQPVCSSAREQPAGPVGGVLSAQPLVLVSGRGAVTGRARLRHAGTAGQHATRRLVGSGAVQLCAQAVRCCSVVPLSTNTRCWFACRVPGTRHAHAACLRAAPTL